MTRLRTAVFIVIMVMLPTVLLLTLAEIGLRWREQAILRWQVSGNLEAWNASLNLHRASEHTELVYEHIPGADVVREGIRIRINQAGFRDHEFPEEVSEDTLRIVVLGDSVAWGWGVEMEAAFPQLLEVHLRAHPESPEPPPLVYNLAVEGYSTRQEVKLLESRGLAFDPDLVVLSYVLNDPDTADGGRTRHFSSELMLLRYARRAHLRIWWALSQDPRIEEYHHRIHNYYREQTRDQFRRLGRIRRKHDVPILVAVTPVFQFGPGEAYRWDHVHDFIQELCVENDLAFVDLYEPFRGMDASEVSLDMWHPNPEGHAVIARNLADILCDAPMLPIHCGPQQGA